MKLRNLTSQAPRRTRSGLLLAGIVCVIAGGGLRAELTWKEKRLTIDPPVGAREVAIDYAFTNTGTTPVQITDVRSGCGCTAAAPAKKAFQPGESGSLRILFTPGSRVGRQTVDITVLTSEPAVKTYDLILEANVKEFVTLVPSMLTWQIGVDAAPKILSVRVAEGFSLISAESTTGDFTVEIAETKDRVTDLRIAPRETWAAKRGILRVKVGREGQPPVEFTAPLRIL